MDCPHDFPHLELHANSAHGDICRSNVEYNEYNVDWICPTSCDYNKHSEGKCWESSITIGTCIHAIPSNDYNYHIHRFCVSCLNSRFLKIEKVISNLPWVSNYFPHSWFQETSLDK